jgi:hypothetical protein
MSWRNTDRAFGSRARGLRGVDGIGPPIIQLFMAAVLAGGQLFLHLQGMDSEPPPPATKAPN